MRLDRLRGGRSLQMGFVASPARGETFVGRRGSGSTLNGKPIQVSQASKLNEGIVGVGYSPGVRPDEFLPMFGRLLREGAMFYREVRSLDALLGRMRAPDRLRRATHQLLRLPRRARGHRGSRGQDLRLPGRRRALERHRVIAGPATLYPALEALFVEPA